MVCVVHSFDIMGRYLETLCPRCGSLNLILLWFCWTWMLWMNDWEDQRERASLDQETDYLTFKLLKCIWQQLSNSLTNHWSHFIQTLTLMPPLPCIKLPVEEQDNHFKSMTCMSKYGSVVGLLFVPLHLNYWVFPSPGFGSSLYIVSISVVKSTNILVPSQYFSYKSIIIPALPQNW